MTSPKMSKTKTPSPSVASAKKASSATPRYKPEAGYSRSEETRRRILEAAIQQFGAHGFEGASTREIAKEAGVNAPALAYHFDGKEGLYRACAQYLVRESRERLRPAIEKVQQVLANAPTRADLIEAILLLQDARVDVVIGADKDGARLRFVAQDQLGTGPEAMSQAVTVGDDWKLLATLISAITGQPADDSLTLLRVISIQGQLMPFYFIPRLTKAMLGWPDFERERLTLIKTVARGQTRALIDVWLQS